VLSGEKPNIVEYLFAHLLQSIVPLEHVTSLPVESNPESLVFGIGDVLVELDLNEDGVSLFLGFGFISIRNSDSNSPIFALFFN
jgi:hypothetical protein